jgi:hypothetical protein
MNKHLIAALIFAAVMTGCASRPEAASTPALEVTPPPVPKKMKDYAFRNYLDSPVAPYVVWGDGLRGGGDEIFGAHWSSLPFTSMGFSGRWGSMGDANLTLGCDINAGLVLPLSAREHGVNIALYGDGVFQIGDYGFHGLIAKYITPAFEAGISFDWGKAGAGAGFDIKYKGSWYEDGHYLHSLGLVFISSFANW